MPYVKFICVHTTVEQSLKYIVNPDKTEEMLYSDSLNCFTDPHCAYLNMKTVFEQHSTHKFNEPLPKKGKGTVKAIHIIQSFSPDDDVTPEQVQSIAKEFVLRNFGDKAQAVITTHTDKEHLHAHIVLNTYALDGQKFNSNWTAVQHARDLSDAICIERGIMPIMLKYDFEKGDNCSYAEWDHRRKGTSWKAHICEYIDSLIPHAKDLDELLKIMEGHGFTINRRKFISVKAPEQQRAVRLQNLGNGYSEPELMTRIQDYLDAQPKQRSMHEIFDLVRRDFERETRNICFAAGVKDKTELLGRQISFLMSNHIQCVGQVERYLEKDQAQITRLDTQITDLSAEIQHKKIVAAAAGRYFGKHKFGGYSAKQKKSDSLILTNAGITSLDDVSGYDDDVAADNERLAEMQKELEELRNHEGLLQSIIKTYSDRETYAQKFDRLVRERLSEQEQEKVKRSQSQKITIYKPIPTVAVTRDRANTDDYTFKDELRVYDLKANPDDLKEILTELYHSHSLNDGDVVRIGDDDTIYYFGDKKFWHLPDFSKSRRVVERERQQELLRQQQERIDAERRRKHQEEQERKKAEEKQNQQSAPKKKKKSI